MLQKQAGPKSNYWHIYARTRFTPTPLTWYFKFIIGPAKVAPQLLFRPIRPLSQPPPTTHQLHLIAFTQLAQLNKQKQTWFAAFFGPLARGIWHIAREYPEELEIKRQKILQKTKNICKNLKIANTSSLFTKCWPETGASGSELQLPFLTLFNPHCCYSAGETLEQTSQPTSQAAGKKWKNESLNFN